MNWRGLLASRSAAALRRLGLSTQFVSLASAMASEHVTWIVNHHCFGAKDKFRCKGVNKKCNDINKDKYLQVLLRWLNTVSRAVSGNSRGKQTWR